MAFPLDKQLGSTYLAFPTYRFNINFRGNAPASSQGILGSASWSSHGNNSQALVAEYELNMMQPTAKSCAHYDDNWYMDARSTSHLTYPENSLISL